MSDIPTDYPNRLNLAEQVARIERTQAELGKLLAERDKFGAESRKYDRDPWILTLAALIAAFAAVIARLPEILHAAGIGS